jgi:hypothetical protein
MELWTRCPEAVDVVNGQGVSDGHGWWCGCPGHENGLMPWPYRVERMRWCPRNGGGVLPGGTDCEHGSVECLVLIDDYLAVVDSADL